MDTPVFKLYVTIPSRAAVLLPPEQIDESFQKLDALQKELGVRNLLSGTLYSDERYRYWGVEWYPSLKVLQAYNDRLDAVHWFQDLHSQTFLGVEDAQFPFSLKPLALDPNVDYLVHIYTSRFTPEAFDVSDAEVETMMKMLNDLDQSLGVKLAGSANSRPFNEKWGSWGVELYPGVDALVKKIDALGKAKWYKYVQAQSFVGTADRGELIGK